MDTCVLKSFDKIEHIIAVNVTSTEVLSPGIKDLVYAVSAYGTDLDLVSALSHVARDFVDIGEKGLISAETLPQLLPQKKMGSLRAHILLIYMVPTPRVELGTY